MEHSTAAARAGLAVGREKMESVLERMFQACSSSEVERVIKAKEVAISAPARAPRPKASMVRPAM